jgi:hypothetical protein
VLCGTWLFSRRVHGGRRIRFFRDVQRTLLLSVFLARNNGERICRYIRTGSTTR